MWCYISCTTLIHIGDLSPWAIYTFMSNFFLTNRRWEPYRLLHGWFYTIPHIGDWLSQNDETNSHEHKTVENHTIFKFGFVSLLINLKFEFKTQCTKRRVSHVKYIDFLFWSICFHALMQFIWNTGNENWPCSKRGGARRGLGTRFLEL